MGNKTKMSFWSQVALANRRRRRREPRGGREEEEGGGEEEIQDQGMFVLESNIFWIPRALVMRIEAPLV